MKTFTLELNKDEVLALESSLSIFAPLILKEEGQTLEYNLVNKLREKLTSLGE